VREIIGQSLDVVWGKWGVVDGDVVVGGETASLGDKLRHQIEVELLLLA